MKEIRFVEAKFRNFLSFGNEWQTIQYLSGINIIQGIITESSKSNGSGKSSLMEVIPFALYGKTMKKTNKEDVINWINKKNCEVHLKFTVDGVLYEIQRGIKPDINDLFIDGVKQPRPAHKADFQVRIESDIIGMDIQTFRNIIYFSPNNTISIINAGKPEKRKFLESLFDVSIYSSMSKVTNEKINGTIKKIDKTKITCESEVKEKERLEKELNESVVPDTIKYRNKINMIQHQIDEMEKVVFEVDEGMISNFKTILKELQDSLKDFESKNRESTTIITVNKRLLNSLDDTTVIDEKRDDLKAQIEKLKQSIIVDCDGDIQDKKDRKKELEERLSEVTASLQKYNNELLLLNKDLDSVNKDIEKAENPDIAEGICDYCEQEITGEYLEKQKSSKLKTLLLRKSEINKLLINVLSEVKSLDVVKKNILEGIESIDCDINIHESNIELSNRNKSLIEQIQNRIDDLPNTDDIKQKIEQYKRIIDSETKNSMLYGGKIHMTELDIEQYTSKIDRLEKEQAKKRDHDNKLESLRHSLKEAVVYYDEICAIAKKVTEENDKKNSMIHHLVKSIEGNTKAVEKLNNMLDYLNYIKVSLKDENAKRFAISSLIPYLNRQANLYLSESGFPYIIQLDAWLDVEIRGLGVQNISYGNLSGGETKCIDIALQLACNDIASMMAKSSLNIMILDELLDSSVDNLGIQSLLNIVKSRQRQKNDAEYIITHRSELSEFTFDSTISIIKDNGFSKVEWQ